MGNYPSVNPVTSVESPVSSAPYLQHALLTFRPSTPTFLAGFTASSASWMYRSPVTNLGLVAELTANSYAGRLKAMGATPTDPIWRAVDAHYKGLFVQAPDGSREQLETPDKVYIGRRTRAVISSQTFTFGTNTAGTVRIRINPAKYIFSDSTPTGALADVTIVADGVDAVGVLATDAAAALLAVPAFAALFNATATLGAVEVESLIAGFPLIVEVIPSTPGPTMSLEVTTVNTPGDYALDLDDIQTAAELGSHLDPPSRKFYWLNDTQWDDVVSLEGMEWVNDQRDTSTYNPPRDYIYVAQSSTGDKVITNSLGDGLGNFNSAATASLSQAAQAAVGGEGYYYAAVCSHDRWEFSVPALLGRTIGYLPGQVSFTSKVLFGSTANAKITGRDYADNEFLAADRSFSWNSAEGANGAHKYGATPNGQFVDRPWLADYCTWLTKTELIAWMQRVNIVTYTDDDIIAGSSIIAAAVSSIPAVIASTVVVRFTRRAAVDPNDIALRVYSYYITFADTAGVINQIGTLADPITITLKDAG